MAQILKQSTAIEVKVGPFLDQTDGFTAETGLTITQAEVLLAKNAGDWAQKNESTSLVHESKGWYRCLLDATDTNTLGMLMLDIQESGALPVWETFWVVTANVFDTLFSTDVFDTSVTQWLGQAVAAVTVNGVPEVDITHIAGSAVSTTTAQLGVNVVQISTDATAADNAESFFDGTGYAGTNNTIPTVTTVNGLAAGVITAASIASDAITDAKVASDVTIASVTGAVGSVTGAVGSVASGGITTASFAAGAINAAAIAADAIGASELAADAVTEIAAGISIPSAAAIADAVWDEAATGHTDAGKAGEQLWTDVDAILVDTGTTLDDLVDTEIATIITDIAAVKADTAAILVDTGTTLDARIPAALVSGRMDSSVGAMAANTMTAAAAAADLATELQSGLATSTALSTLQTTANTISTFVDTEISDIQSRIPTALVGGRMDSSTGAMAANTLTASALATDAVSEIVAALLTTAATEAYSTDGSTLTLAQFMYEVSAMLQEHAISGTTWTIKKRDGTTTGLVLTLNDATTPTGVTRAS